ncbi:hypothetical protein IQ06DRAFT_292025 [Phaeosphaeriaceae sp. SRC1lsM3a]|nr:hypothetical protein IQ06DRAFT_292025 [Stagonospora sp. SRC1lsM3a]
MPHLPRAFLHLRWRIVLVLFITAVCYQQHRFYASRQSLAAKYSPTHFGATHRELQSRAKRPDIDDHHFRDHLLSQREHWQRLGEGWEGKVFSYKDSVIKTFTPGRSPFRNCAPETEDAGEKWPTEIAASLRFGGHKHNTPGSELTDDDYASTALHGFLPVKSYFKAAASEGQEEEWHLVTPMLKGGNLKDLAKKVAHNPKLTKTRDMDAYFRPVFENLLSDIQRLHEANYCHDDIKPNNVFIANRTHWVLGDLGNLRHVTHPYHSSQLWADNDQLSDCRANDVMRLLKTYMQFLKRSTNNDNAFNDEFMAGKEPFSRLFWMASRDAPVMSASILRRILMAEYPEQPAKTQVDDEISASVKDHASSTWFFKQSRMNKEVRSVIATKIGEKSARWWGMVGIFGIPESEVCGF